MGYKTKSMIYAKSLKASLNATSEKKAKGTAEAILNIGLGYTDVKPNAPESTNVEKMTPKPTPKSVTESLIKKAPEKKAKATKREKRKSDRKGVDSGVLSGLASGSKGTQTGTALGIMVKKIAGAVKGKKAKSATTTTTATTTAAAAKTSAANKAKGFSETPAPMPAKTKADSFRFYEDSGMNKSTPKKATPKKVVKAKVGKPSDSFGIMKADGNKSFGVMKANGSKPKVGKPGDSKGVMKTDGNTSVLKSDGNKSMFGTFIQEGINKSTGVKANPKPETVKAKKKGFGITNEDIRNAIDGRKQAKRKAEIIAYRKSQGYSK
jgi:hypothetical protein